MNKTIKKAAIVLVAILSISLVAGNILFAEDRTFSSREPVLAGISTADVESVTTGFSKSGTSDTDGATESEISSREPVLAGISATDVEFAARPYTSNVAIAANTTEFSSREPVLAGISAADIGFVNAGEGTDKFGETLLCVVDGVQASGSEQCVR